jgi:hypothetical protein
MKVQEADALGTPLRSVASIPFKPYEVKFVLVGR